MHCLSNCCRVVMRADTSEASLREALGVGDRNDGNCPAGEAPLLLYPFPEAEYLEVCPTTPLPTRAILSVRTSLTSPSRRDVCVGAKRKQLNVAMKRGSGGGEHSPIESSVLTLPAPNAPTLPRTLPLTDK